MGGTFVQSLIDEQKHRVQSDIVPNGIKSADGDNSRIDEVVREVVEEYNRNYSPPKR
jgi:hypothetical protein